MILATVTPLDGVDPIDAKPREGMTTRICGDDVDATWATVTNAARAHLRQDGTESVRVDVREARVMQEYPPDA